MIRIGLCDDDSLVRQLLADTLEDEGLHVVTVSASGEEAVADETQVDVWLVDLRMPGIDGRETTRRLLRRRKTKVILMTAFGDGQLIASLGCGASAYINKDATPAQLTQAIHSVMAGFTVVTPSVLQRALHPGSDLEELHGVSTDEVDEQIVHLMGAGDSYEDISRAVGMSVSGIKKRTGRIMSALGVGSRAQLVAKVYGLRD
jgi:DNA-binding NarL/FixJ family response regulator